ncbi:MAG: single-stranded DNA-binding protein [Deltaproteobacteria bacterium]|nr:single-stranded DNA-binding protein [Deltaproteobacteria bacterium]
MHPLLKIADKLSQDLSKLSFAEPVSHIYNPHIYARRPFARYVEMYANSPVEVLLLGMNPGPFGMTQTGIPFGEVVSVRDWLGIIAKVDQPTITHPRRPIEGFDCPRSEVSGVRLWGWAKQTFKNPKSFFKKFFVANYCPLVFMEASGRNRTPDKLARLERDALFKICDAALVEIVAYLKPRYVIGVGAFAQNRAQQALANNNVNIGSILHPSPANPLANRGWSEAASKALATLGIT